MKILFVIPDSVRDSGGRKNTTPAFPHLGIAYLTAVLQKEAIDIKIVDMRLGYSFKDLSNHIIDFVPNLVGVTSFSFGYQNSYELIEYSQQNHANIPVMIGGPHVAAVGYKSLRDSRADFAVDGEGEMTMVEFCHESQKEKPDYSAISGLIWKNGEDIKVNQKRDLIKDLDSIPFPAYDAFELEKYISASQRLVPIITSRGCPYQCVYCSVKLSMGRGFRGRSPENVVQEIESWYKKGWKVFDINDDCFTLDIERAKKICQLIQEKELNIDYKLYNGIRADRLTLELAQEMKNSGCSFVAIGAESGNAEVLKNIKKRVTLEKISEAIKICNQVGLPNQLNFIIGHPGEDLAKARDTIKFASQQPTNFAAFYNCVPYPGTELFDWIEKNNLFRYPPEQYLNRIGYYENEPIYETPEFPVSDRKQALKEGMLYNRKSLLYFKLGKFLGAIAYQFAKSDTLWNKGAGFFKGNKIGDKIFNFTVKIMGSS